MLVVFPKKKEKADDAQRAIRAGLRMQRAMKDFAEIQTPTGIVNLQMRIGIHSGGMEGEGSAPNVDANPARQRHALRIEQ